MDNLGSKLRETLKNITKSIFIDKKLINELVKDIQRALLSADVNVKLVFDLTERIKKRALEEKEPKGVDKKTHIVNIVYEEVVNFLGKEEKGIIIEKKKPFKIMMTGLYGSGKTTSIGKLANYYKKRGHKIAAIGLDVHRPAAPLQLKQLCDSINVDCFINQKEKKYGIGEIDNHESIRKYFGIKFKVFPFDFAFKTIRTHITVDTPFLKSDSDIEKIHAALKNGKSFVSNDYFINAKGFQFYSENDRIIARLPRAAKIKIIKNGNLFAESFSDTAIIKPDGKGVYRCECYLKKLGFRPWIFSNPIFI